MNDTQIIRDLAEVSRLKRQAREDRDRRIREYRRKYPDDEVADIARRFGVDGGVVRRALGLAK